jgi:hypothetical protein
MASDNGIVTGGAILSTGLAMFGDDLRVEPRTFGGERRADRRYGICLDVQWRLVHRRRVVDSGSGWTRDLSSHGILFETGRLLTAGKHMELSISWPVLLNDTAPLKLVAAGRVVRWDETCAAVCVTHYEFRTAGRTGGNGSQRSSSGFAASH